MGEKKITGRKRHLLVDICGNVLHVVVHAANTSDRDGCWDVIDGAIELFPDLRHIWVDGGYRGIEDDIALYSSIALEVVNIPSWCFLVVG